MIITIILFVVIAVLIAALYLVGIIALYKAFSYPRKGDNDDRNTISDTRFH